MSSRSVPPAREKASPRSRAVISSIASGARYSASRASSSGSRCSDERPRLEPAVGAEEQRVAGGEVGVVALHLGVVERAEHGAAAEQPGAALAHVDRRRMPGARRGQRPFAALDPPQPHQHRGGEVVQPGPLEQELVDPPEHLLGLVDLAGQPAHRVAHRDRDPGRRRPLAGDVADQHPAAVVGRQHVVEVAADLDPAPGRLEDDRGHEPRHPHRPRRAQAALQVAGDRVALLVEPRVVDRQRGAVAELTEELELDLLVADVRLRVEEGEGADLPPPRDQRDDRGRLVAGVVDQRLVLGGLGDGIVDPRLFQVAPDHRVAARAAPGRPGGRRPGRAARRGGSPPAAPPPPGSSRRRPSRRSARPRG